MDFDIIIVGQGICGTFLSHYLQQEGLSVLVIDRPITTTASRIASGVINPVTGRRIVKTWMIDELLPFARNAYLQIDTQVISDCSILEFHPTLQMQQAFQKRIVENADYISDATRETQWHTLFDYEYGIGSVSPSLHIDLQTFLDNYRKKITASGFLLEEEFDIKYLQVFNDSIQYKDFHANKIIFCDGVNTINNPFFTALPFAPNKGEAIILEIPDLPNDHIYKQGLSLVPWDKKKQQFWIGSTYNWQYDNVLPTKEFAERVTSVLDKWLKLPYQKVAHFAAERPANTQRRPFVGLHPKYPTVGILNGMGTKGCSLAPYFAKQLTEFILHKIPIAEEGDIKRFEI